jgi:ketosteroid isomerase-like protein
VIATRWLASALLGGVVLLAAPAASQPTQSAKEAEREIRARRESSNRAIARHDSVGFAAILTPDVVSVTSASAKNVGRAAVVASMLGRFRDRPDVIYVRSPEEVSVFAAWGMASEEGHWRGSWTDPDGKVEISGSYFAKWRRINGAWFVEGETYVPEKCTGGKFCSTVP